jgi:hypothetical protein
MAYVRGARRSSLVTKLTVSEPQATLAAAPAAPRPKVTRVFDPSKCGTYAGYRQHDRYNVPTCDPCKDAMAAYSRDYYDRIGGRPKPEVPSTVKRGPGKNPKHGSGCGTYNGYGAHHRAGTPVCDPCKEARRAYRKERDRAVKAGDGRKRRKAFDPTLCGTRSGYQQHLRHENTACMDCRRASAAYIRAYRASIRKAAA